MMQIGCGHEPGTDMAALSYNRGITAMRNLHNLMLRYVAGAIAGLLAACGAGLAQDAQNPEGDLARDLSVVQKPIFDIGQLQPARRIDVDAWLDNPSLTYAIGQPLRLLVRPHQDAYVTVVDVGSSGRVSILYPNHFQLGGRVRAGTTVAIPTRSAHWQIKVDGPAGVDLIQVIASRRPLTLPELAQLVRTTAASPMVTLGRSAEDVARDLIPQLKPELPTGAHGSQSFGIRNVLVRIVADAVLAPPAPAAAIVPIAD
jgi:hypothetical protein